MKTAICILGLVLAAGLTGGARAATYYVDTSIGNDANTPARAENPATPWASITNALAYAADSDVVEVAAGVYPAAVEIGVPLTLRGPNADIPWNGARNPEAILMPAGNDTANGSIVAFRTNHVSICGFVFDGDNPTVSGGVAVNSADVNVLYGVANTMGTASKTRRFFDHFTFQNNIVRNMNLVALSLAGSSAGASSWNTIRGNFFTNVYFRAISAGTHVYMDTQSNQLDTVMSGIFSGTVALPADPGFVPTIAHNTVILRSTGRTGTYSAIWLNHRYNPASYRTWVVDNTVEVAGPLPSIYCGIALTTFVQGAAVIASNNIVRGNGYEGNGYYSWNNSVVANVQIVGGTVTGVKHGVYVAWWDYIMGPYNSSYMGASCCTVDCLVLTNNVVGIVSSNSTPVVRNSLIADGQDGLSVILGTPTFENCTVVNNADAGLRRLAGTPLVRNGILWANGTDVIGDVTPSMFSYSDIGNGGFPENHCISADPRFQGAGNYDLSWSSPCRNAGIIVEEWMTGALDVAGNPRIHHTKVDMDAYELQGGDASQMILR